MHPIAPVKKLHHRGIPVGHGRLSQIQRKIEYAKRVPMRARQIRVVVRVAIQVGIDVVALGFVIAVVNPTSRRGVGVEGRERQ